MNEGRVDLSQSSSQPAPSLPPSAAGRAAAASSPDRERAGAVRLQALGEDELLGLAFAYDEAALGEVYDRYESRIHAYIYRRTGDEGLAEDLTAQVFMKMLQAIRDRKAWHSSFSGWLYRIAHNLVIDFYRQRDRQPSVGLDETPDIVAEHDDPVASVEQQLTAERVRLALRRLTEEQAEVLSLRFLEGFSINEVAVMMNKTEGAIKALQYRAVATMRLLLEHEGLHE
jgi:RNA polymerase sigma-70 factor (ECF subfamily)